MGFSLNPVSAIKVIIEGKQRKHERVATYLDDIAEQATSLANVWQNVVETVATNGAYRVPDDVLRDLLSTKLVLLNSTSYFRLQEHYKQVSAVMGKRYSNEMHSIIFHIGSLIRKRDLTKEMLTAELMNIKHAKLFHPGNTVSGFNSLHESVNSLHKEAAALHVRAQTFRSKP